MSYKKRILGTLVLASGFSAACVSVDRDIYKQFSQRREASKIEVKYRAPLTPYAEVGTLSIQYNRGYERQKILNMLKDEAAKAGADGFLIKASRDTGAQWQLQGRNGVRQDSFNSGQRRLSVIMYRYLE